MGQTGQSKRSQGKVYLVGVGPGDPGLLTVRGAECLGRADLVLYDGLIHPAVLLRAADSAEMVCVSPPGPGGQGRWPQGEVNRRLVEAARQGRTVVRLKAGDPVVFGRAAEEREALRAAGIAFEVVPGVTAATAAAAYAEIPLTHAEQGSAVALVTGQESHLKTGEPLDYAALAGFPGTLVFYMGVESVAHWSQRLVAGGKPPNTPVLIVRRCSWPDQRTVRATLGTVAQAIQQGGLQRPAVIIVGPAAQLAPDESWFDRRPLRGLRVMVTRPRSQASELGEMITRWGADVVYQPAIAIADPPDWRPVDAALERLDQFDWLVFTSINAVRYFFDRLWRRGGDLRRLGSAKLAVIGPGTAGELARYGLAADVIPATYHADALAAALAGQARGRRFLLVRASRGRPVLADQLRQADGHVEQIAAYSSIDVTSPDDELVGQMETGQIDWVTVTSSAIARALVGMFGRKLHRTRLASISPITSAVLRQLGFIPAAEARQYTMDGLVRALCETALGSDPPSHRGPGP